MSYRLQATFKPLTASGSSNANLNFLVLWLIFSTLSSFNDTKPCSPPVKTLGAAILKAGKAARFYFRPSSHFFDSLTFATNYAEAGGARIILPKSLFLIYLKIDPSDEIDQICISDCGLQNFARKKIKTMLSRNISDEASGGSIINGIADRDTRTLPLN
jgi:hypothetical protein